MLFSLATESIVKQSTQHSTVEYTITFITECPPLHSLFDFLLSLFAYGTGEEQSPLLLRPAPGLDDRW
jgi:hypothetical protein